MLRHLTTVIFTTRINGHLQDLKSSMKTNGKKSRMADHLRETHNGTFDSKNPVKNWLVTLRYTNRKPLDRQVTEYIDIRNEKLGVRPSYEGRTRCINICI